MAISPHSGRADTAWTLFTPIGSVGAQFINPGGVEETKGNAGLWECQAYVLCSSLVTSWSTYCATFSRVTLTDVRFTCVAAYSVRYRFQSVLH